jgi:aryl-alcohol dehydrogenase-like predicted oxidoreductase
MLGRTGIRVSVVAFGAGPVSGWMAELTPEEQAAVIRRAPDAGITWLDTVAGYGSGRSESSLGRALARLGLRCVTLLQLHHSITARRGRRAHLAHA